MSNDSNSGSLYKEKYKPNKCNLDARNLAKNWQLMTSTDNKREKNLFYNKINNNRFNKFKKNLIKNNKENPFSLNKIQNYK